MTAKPTVAIEYCRQCNWMLRAGWMAQELLQTFSEELGGVTLIPGTGGIFRITVTHDGQQTLIWDRKTEESFPQPKVLKQRLRDVIDPDLALGHSDRA
ncbi:SelT/SelW/SelH family protein [Breoghania sp.]|uniref:SelT/SelW/SelH family protein n=1 Tax=Breoghania sp. TaxID=2065378 RepID=UPI002AAC047D|nr:SelT/SelW/SelH family protein [Breoghania sp.]